MFVADPLYGGTHVPAWLGDVILTPEVQRLRGIRLINTSSPTLAALSDARRYTHTLGVLHLALRIQDRLTQISDGLRRALLASVIAHDLATPPFGHVFEYLLKATTGWSHEQVVSSLLEGTYRPEGIYSQILPGRQLALRSTLETHSVDPNLVALMVRGDTELGVLVAGSIDLDNLDNVFRMAHLLGLPGCDLTAGRRLVDGLNVNGDGLVVDPTVLPLLDVWSATRRAVYSVLAFDETNLQGQAMLTDCLTTAMEAGLIGVEHWYWTDEWLLYRLQRFDETKRLTQRFFAGDLYETIFIGWYDVAKGALDLRLPAERSRLRDALQSQLSCPCSPYVFYDNGTFSKSLAVNIAGSDAVWPDVPTISSRSTIVGVFTPHRSAPAHAVRAITQVLDEFGLPADALKPIPLKDMVYGLPGQTKLPV